MRIRKAISRLEKRIINYPYCGGQTVAEWRHLPPAIIMNGMAGNAVLRWKPRDFREEQRKHLAESIISERLLLFVQDKKKL